MKYTELQLQQMKYSELLTVLPYIRQEYCTGTVQVINTLRI